MISFAEFLKEAYFKNQIPEKGMTPTTAQDLKKTIGETRFKALIKHKWFAEHAGGGYDKAYKHGVNRVGDHEVEVYPYMASVHTTPEGKVRPDKMLRFHFYKQSVSNVHQFRRPTDSKDWYWVKSMVDDE